MTSEIAVFDLGKGAFSAVLRSGMHLEAPNWSPCGHFLLVNSEGRLFRLPLDAPALRPIDTGFARALNNDHGFSPDGRHIAISDKSETGQSTIYVLPAGGGRPKRLTERDPSYFHGWSPDGTTLAYAGFRGAEAEIFTCPATGGRETQITLGFDHCDGPDYTPDGRWIWFNGERDGAVDLWRVRPDGTGLERMTSDDRVNWFPHPSPDGRLVLFLAYEAGTQGHPAERSVQLRIMAAEGGAPRVLCDLRGGQGTLNVPCWAPDGRRFAFAHYPLEDPAPPVV